MIGCNHSLTLTFTRAGTFPDIDVGDFVLGMQRNVMWRHSVTVIPNAPSKIIVGHSGGWPQGRSHER